MIIIPGASKQDDDITSFLLGDEQAHGLDQRVQNQNNDVMYSLVMGYDDIRRSHDPPRKNHVFMKSFAAIGIVTAGLFYLFSGYGADDNIHNDSHISGKSSLTSIARNLFGYSDEFKGYRISVIDDSITNPFILTEDMVDVSNNIAESRKSDLEKAFMAYDWVEKNIVYGVSKRKNGYRDSEETLSQREGVCGEMAYLIVSMARASGLTSKWCHVTKDFKGDNVQHACAAIYLDDHWVLADPAYHQFDAKHKEIDIMDDDEALYMFRRMRGGR